MDSCTGCGSISGVARPREFARIALRGVARGANMAVRRSAVQALGGWDTRFVIGGEEEELFRRALETGQQIIYSPVPLVEHNFDNTWADLLGRSHRYGRGNARMHEKHGGLPTIYPAPVLLAGGLALAPLSPRIGIAALAVPYLIFSVWGRRAWQERALQPLLFPYLQVAQEAASNVGWVQAWLRERTTTGGAP